MAACLPLMTPIGVRKDLLESTRGQIVGLLRRRASSVEEIAAELGVTGNAVRGHLRNLERDGLVRPHSSRPGATRPSVLYELTPEVEILLSRAYTPLLGQLVRLFARDETPERFDRLMREAGRSLAHELSPRFPKGDLETRVRAAVILLHDDLGASTELERTNSHFVIRGHGCPIAALTDKHPGVCHAIESMLAEFLGAEVHECCDRSQRPRCCFEISEGESRGPQDRVS
jgi:DeoR family transcriptional regulator, suf operon transcriptional repressor